MSHPDTGGIRASVAAAAMLTLAGACGHARPTGPSVVVLVADTLRADMVGCYGYPGPSSPELDALAADGVRFSQVVAQSTWTRPSLGSMLTSLHPRTLGLYDEARDVLGSEFTTLAEAFQAAGYTTVGVTANPNINGYFQFDQGFDYYVDSHVVFDFMPCAPGQEVRNDTKPLPSAAAVMRAVLEALEVGPPPYYVQVDLMEVHEARLLTELDRLGPLFANEPVTERRRYVQAVRELSGHVGAFVEELAARPGFDDALFAVVSDHGEFLEGEHAHVGDPRTHGFLVYESQARVPWILYSPAGRLPRGRVIDEPVELLDLMPTVLAWAGLEPPAGLAGRSLVPLIEDPAAALERPEFFVVETRFRGAHKIAAFTRDWELVQTSDGHPGVRPLELQPRGLQDGAATDMSLERPDEADRLSGLLRTWMEAHPEAPATYASTEVPARVARHLGELGYL